MKPVELSEWSTPDLVKRFATIGVAQDEALLGGSTTRFRRLFMLMSDVVGELKNRDGDQRRALLQLFDDPNIQVRLMAARNTLAVAPVEARRQIQTVADSRWLPQAGDAGMCLDFLDNGTFKPT